jgi:hypothetical protein
MPLYLRKFIFNEIKIYHDEQNEQSNKNSSTVNPQKTQQYFSKKSKKSSYTPSLKKK